MEITPEELKTKLDRGERLTLIDVRDPEEYATCRLEEAKLIPLKELGNRFQELDPADSIVVYCHYGKRSAQAALWLKKKGFRNVKSLEGGINAWADRIDPSLARY